jgi:hypothetical protein
VPVPLNIAVNRQAGAKNVTRVQAWISTDDGERWQPVGVVPVGDHGVALTPPEESGQYVSLHVRAQDADGASVDQTTTRAYRIR